MHGDLREADEPRGGLPLLLLEPRAVERGGAEEPGAGDVMLARRASEGNFPRLRVGLTSRELTSGGMPGGWGTKSGRAPFGAYNITNPGFVTTRQVVEMIQKVLKPNRPFDFWQSDEEFYRVAAKTPRSNCVLDVSKLLSTGVKLRPVREALEHSLQHWKPEPSSTPNPRP